MEGLAGAAGALLTGAEGPEVFGRAGSGVGIELHHDPAKGLVADLHVEEDLRV